MNQPSELERAQGGKSLVQQQACNFLQIPHGGALAFLFAAAEREHDRLAGAVAGTGGDSLAIELGTSDIGVSPREAGGMVHRATLCDSQAPLSRLPVKLRASNCGGG